MSEPAPTFQQVHRQLTNLCEEGGLERPDLIVDTLDGEFAAIWVDSELVVVIGEEEEATHPNPAEDPQFREIVESVFARCDEEDAPRPDAARFDASTGRIEFGWTREPGKPEDLDKLAAGISGSGVRASVAGAR